jgi:hypothetical protein
MPEPNPALIIPVLINGAIFATVAVIVPAFLLSRFTRDIIGRSVLVIFLFIAAGAYFGFATLGREVVDTQPIWMLVELAQVIVLAPWPCSVCAAPRTGLPQDGCCIPSGTL